MRPSAFIAPQLATLVDEAPSDAGWLFETKYDGYRIQAHVRKGAARLYTRTGLDWTERFPRTAAAVAKLRVRSAILDGEVIVNDAHGRSSFQALQRALEEGGPIATQYAVFDLLALDGHDLRALPLDERRLRLRRLLRTRSGAGPLRVSEAFDGEPRTLLARLCARGLEGMIGKRLDGPYRSGRSRDWVKVKCGRRQEFVVIGYTDPQRSRPGLGALLLAVRGEDGALRYAGKAGTGMSHDMLVRLERRLRRLGRATPAPMVLHPLLPRRAHWVTPTLVVEIAFTEWTRDGLLRHPSVQGLRDDKAAADVIRERPAHLDRSTEMPIIAGVTITHPERIVYPELGLTKLDVARYVAKVAPRMLPHVAGRPLTFVRCPEGIADACFFQKHWTGTLPPTLDSVGIRQRDGRRPYVVVRDATGLVTLVQWGVLEVHLWGARADDPERPDRVLFDLDPGERTGWDDVRAGAVALRALLRALGLACWLKTSGGKGLHVMVPLARHATWDEVADFARAVAERMAETAPTQFVSVASKAKRPGKIFIDWLRNTRGATWVAPWSMRARASAGVSMPLSWRALGAITAGDASTLPDVASARLPADAWKGALAQRQRITRDMMRRLGAG